MKRWWPTAVLGACVLLQGCAADQMRAVVPAALADQAQVVDRPGVRIWGDTGSGQASMLLDGEKAALIAKYRERATGKQPLVSNLLAISGGADDGAFSAGLLVGWSRRGDRPLFDLVTGISAGALVAPFVFVGTEMDGPLSEIFVKYGNEDIYQAKILSGVLGGPAIADNAPLARLIARYVDRKLLARIAAERARGRFLLIGTTNLAAQRPVYWDMGRIAQGNDQQSLDLFRKVLLASAALPGIFPPVHIDVTAGGKTFTEVHVDGGPTREVFFSPADFSFRTVDKLVGKRVQRRLWIIRNGKVTPEYAIVPETALAISARAIETLTKNQGIGDLVRMYERARADGIDYNLAYIPAEFTVKREAPFSRSYMKQLYEKGRALGAAGYRWSKAPPEVDVAAAR